MSSHGDLSPSEEFPALTMPMSEFLLLERALCSCEAGCECGNLDD